MPLTVRQNGSVVGGQPNTVAASWWNDYHDLLTGVMTDQDITTKADLLLQPIGGPPVTAPTLALAAGSTLGIGAYSYYVTFIKHNAFGESLGGPVASITTTSGNQAVNLSAIPLGPAGTVNRHLYRTKVGGSTYYYLGAIADNTTTTYADTVADTALGGTQFPHSGFGGRLEASDATGTVNATLYGDGYFQTNNGLSVKLASSFDNGAITTDGTGNLTATSYKAGGLVVPVFGTGSYAGQRIFVMPGTPTGAVKGDVWIKTPF